MLSTASSGAVVTACNHPKFFSDESVGEPKCPLCEKYERGPCKIQFQTWYQCAQKYGDDHVEECAKQFKGFHHCLDKHEDFYSLNLDALNESSVEWQKIIDIDLKDVPREPFPWKPEVKLRGTSVTIELVKEGLVMAYANHDNNLVMAGALADFEAFGDDGVVVEVPAKESVSFFAVYENDESQGDLRVFVVELDKLSE